MMVINLTGDLSARAPWNIIGNDFIDMRLKNGHFVLESYRTVYQKKEYLTFSQGKAQVEQLYGEWFNTMKRGYTQSHLSPIDRKGFVYYLVECRPSRWRIKRLCNVHVKAVDV